MKIFYGFLVSFSLAFFVSADLEAVMRQGIEDADTVALRQYMGAEGNRHIKTEFVSVLLKDNKIRKSILGRKFQGSEQEITLKNYEVAAEFLRERHTIDWMCDDPNPEGAFGLAKLLAKRGFYPVGLGLSDGNSLDVFRTEVLESLDEMIGVIMAPQNPMKAEKKANFAFHAHLWKAIIFMDGYDQNIWGGANKLDDAWDSVLTAQTFRDTYNFSRSVYLWKSMLISKKGHRPLVVPVGEDGEVYHKDQAQNWFEIYNEVVPAPVQVAHHMPMEQTHVVTPNHLRRSGARTEYARELREESKHVRKALQEWQAEGAVQASAVAAAPAPAQAQALAQAPAPAVAAAAPAHGFSDNEDEEGNGQGPAEAMDEQRDDQSFSSSPSMPSFNTEDEMALYSSSLDSEDEEGNGEGPLEDIDGVEGMMDEEPSSGPEKSAAGAVGMDHPQDSETDEEVSPSKKGKGKRVIESSDEEEDGYAEEGTSSSSCSAHKKKKSSYVYMSPDKQKERDEEICSIFDQDPQRTHAQIAEQITNAGNFGDVNRSVVRQVLLKNGKNKFKCLSPEKQKERDEEICSIFDQDPQRTHAQISEQITNAGNFGDVNRSVVRQVLLKNGKNKFKCLSPEKQKERDEEICSIFDQDPQRTHAQISEQITNAGNFGNVSEYMVSRVLSNNGRNKFKRLSPEKQKERDEEICSIFNRNPQMTHVQIAEQITNAGNFENVSGKMVSKALKKNRKS